MTRSILSLLSSACASVTATRGSGAAVRGSLTWTLTRRGEIDGDTRQRLASLAVKNRDRISRLKPKHARQMLRFVVWQVHLTGCRKIRNVEAMHVEDCSGDSRAPAQAGRPCILRPVFFRGQAVGKYKILSPLGSGGFGTVYLAEDTWIDKKVAIKVPHRQNVDFGDLLREPRLLASLNHPNIVSILTAEKQSNIFFIVMEYVAGDTLETVISRDGSIDLARTLDYTCQICNAIDHAHQNGVIHRDLRPGQRPGIGGRALEGRRLRHVALHRDRGAWHNRDRQPAVHGA